jgi:hypothetical protein
MLTQSDLNRMRVVVSDEIKKETGPINNRMKTMESDITHIRKNTDSVINFFDREYLELRKRVDRIEEHLGLTSQA